MSDRRLIKLRDIDGDQLIATRRPDGSIRITLRDKTGHDWQSYVEITEADAADLAAALT